MRRVLKLVPLCSIFLATLVMAAGVASHKATRKESLKVVKNQPAASAPVKGRQDGKYELNQTPEAVQLQQEIRELKARIRKMEGSGNVSAKVIAKIKPLQVELAQMQERLVGLIRPDLAQGSEVVPQQLFPVAPDNDNCTDAEVVSCPGGLTIYATPLDTTGATTEFGELESECGSPLNPVGSHSVWYLLAGDGSAVSINTADSTYDTVLDVFVGPACGDLDPLTCGDQPVCNDDIGVGITGITSALSFVTDSGVDYWIRVSSYGFSPGGKLRLSISCDDPLSCSLDPEEAVNPNVAGAMHTVTLTVAASEGTPVHFSISSGPNAGQSFDTTVTMGTASWTYTHEGGVGTDVICVCGDDTDGNNTPFRCCATKCWDELTCPADMLNVPNDEGMCSASVSYTTPASQCAGVSVYCDPASPVVVPVGTTTTVVCTTGTENGAVVDPSTCDFDISVIDTEDPTFPDGCPAPDPVNTTVGCSTVVVYSTPGAADNCPGVTVDCVPPSGSTFDVGVTEVCCTATDASMNTAECCFDVTVTESVPPEITCPMPITQECPGAVSFVVTATDNCSPPNPAPTIVCTPPSGSMFAVGTTEVCCTATDAAGNTDTCCFDVTIIDSTDPVIDCPEEGITVSQGPFCSGATVDDYGVTATDNCPGEVTIECTPPEGTTFPVGTTTVCCTATDASGNTDECCFDVTVTPFTLILEHDQVPGSCVVISRSCTAAGTVADPDPATYCWKLPDGTIITGTCFIVNQSATQIGIISDPMDPNRIQGAANFFSQSGNVRLWVPKSPPYVVYGIIDSNILDSECDCVPE
ncbi:MAG: HYR domain-containing protein [Acidobacteria bacterium]|nr:HYR domain-containing protein [Acidobacteriota bacterium]